MMKFLTDRLTFIAIFSLALLAACSSTKKVEVDTIMQDQIIVEPDDPRSVTMRNIHWIVLTPENIMDLINTDMVLFAITVDDYEDLSLNMADIIRYIKQQKEIIIFYKRQLHGTKERSN